MGRLSRIIQVSPKANHMDPCKGEAGGAVFAHTEEKRQCGQRDVFEDTLGFEDGERGHEPRNTDRH